MDDRARPQLGSDYWRLLTSAAASNLGDGVRLAALPLLAVTLTDEPLLISGVAAATFLPAVLFGPMFLRDHRLLRAMAASVGLMNLAAATGGSVLVILVVEDLAAAEATFGFVLAAGAVAGFLGSIVAERIVTSAGRGRTLVGAVVVITGALLAIALAPSVVVVGAGMAAMGFGVTVFNIPGRAVRQEVVPDHLLGRVISSYRVIGFLGVPIGAVLGGILTDLAGVRTAYVVAAGLMAAAVGAMLAAVRHLPRGPRPSPASSA